MKLSEISLKSVLTGVLFSSLTAQAVEASNGLEKAYSILEKSSIGKSLLEEVKEQGLSITEGSISKTEIVATRTTSGNNEKLEFHVQVLISKDKNPVFQAIDLAHELAHALHPKMNPFDPNLNAVDYIRQGIEAEGGEAQAIMQECKVGAEISRYVADEEARLIKARCKFVWHAEKDETLWKKSFYHLGKYSRFFLNKLVSINHDQQKNEEMIGKVQTRDPLFTSATANKPYPLALLDEYVEITKKICNRSQGKKNSSMVDKTLEERCQYWSSAQFKNP
jgi:hypothetical protein